MKYLYALRNRPPGYATVPAHWSWEYVEVPAYMAPHRPDLPVTTKHRHGLISSETQLTPDQLAAFEIEWVNDPDKDPDDVLKRLYRIMRTTEFGDWPKEAQEGRRLFLQLHHLLNTQRAPLPKCWGKRQAEEP